MPYVFGRYKRYISGAFIKENDMHTADISEILAAVDDARETAREN